MIEADEIEERSARLANGWLASALDSSNNDDDETALICAVVSIAASLREIAGLMRDEAMPIEVTANSIEELRGALGLTPIGGAS